MTRRSIGWLLLSVTLSFACVLHAQSKPSEMRPRDTKETADRGAAVFQCRCAICHFAESTEKKVGPGLRGLMKNGKRGAAPRWDAAAVTRVIQNGGKDMPGFRGEINDAQLRDLLAYLRTL
jgi:cytochrome c